MANIKQFMAYDKLKKEVVGSLFFNHDLNIMTQDWIKDFDIPQKQFKDRIIMFPYTDYRFQETGASSGM